MTEPRNTSDRREPDRRTVLLTGTAALTALALPLTAIAQMPTTQTGDKTKGTFTTTDGKNIFYKDWGPKNAQPIVFHHCCPPSVRAGDGIRPRLS